MGKSVRKLKNIWYQLDRASGELENAINNMADLGMDAESLSVIQDSIVIKKNEIEGKIIEQGGKMF